MIQVNQDRMDSLMKAFYTLTRLRIVLFDDEWNEAMCFPPQHCDFCRQMRSRPGFYQQCVASDRAAFRQCRNKDEPIIYVCHAGLTEAVIQLRDGNSVVGYIMFGQVIPQETSSQTRARLDGICRAQGVYDLRDTIAAMPDKSAEEIRAAATILGSLSAYLWSNRLITLPRKEFIEGLDNFIEQHLAGSITAEDLCAYFGIGKTTLYKMAAKHLDCCIAAYIKKSRISAACRLLKETGRPVTEIAFATGFSDYNYFSKCFRAQTGITASAYRKQNSTP